MILLIGGLKGGTGASTLAVNLSTQFAHHGRSALLVDCAENKTSYLWHLTRQSAAHTPPVKCFRANGKEVIEIVERHQPGVDHTIIDAGSGESVQLRAAMTIADLFIVPLQPSQFDLWTLERVHELFEKAKGYNESLALKVVLNRSPSHHPGSQIEDAISAIEEISTGLFGGVVIGDRAVYQQAALLGQSVIEWQPLNEKAKSEMSMLTEWALNNGEQQHGNNITQFSKDKTG